MTAFPWGEAMRFGFGTLRLGPREFWGLTPRELAAAFEGIAGRSRGRPPERQTMDRLMAAFPDEEKPIG
ncbi:MAG: phage tail assembly chaperone [Devosia sp.]|nr:phage tail assembly chaperone [Devosia sp.]